MYFNLSDPKRRLACQLAPPISFCLYNNAFTPLFSKAIKTYMYTCDSSTLPSRIQEHLAQSSHLQGFKCAIKTAVKPSATIPILWLVATNDHLIFANTHRSNGIYKEFPWQDISEIRRKGSVVGRFALELVFKTIQADDEILALSPDVSLEKINEFIAVCNQLLSTGRMNPS